MSMSSAVRIKSANDKFLRLALVLEVIDIVVVNSFVVVASTVIC